MSNRNALDDAPSRLFLVLEALIFGRRPLVLILFLIGTLFMGHHATQLRMAAGFEKMLPYSHPFVETFHEYDDAFGGGNTITVVLMARDGDIFSAEFFSALRAAHDRVFDLEGVNRATISSLLAADTVYIDIVESGLEGGRVVPVDFAPTAEMMERVRTNIQRANLVGRLVSVNLDGALISADLRGFDPRTGEPLDYRAVAEALERLRAELQAAGDVSVHITGFAKSSTDIADGATSVAFFFFVTALLVAGLVFLYSGSVWLTLSTMVAALVAVVWQLGLLQLTGLGIDPMNVLIPFLVFAVGISHSIQMMNGWTDEILRAHPPGSGPAEYIDPGTGARRMLRRLLVPAALALVTTVLGFLTLFLIEIQIIQELALGAILGLVVLIPTQLLLLPVLLSYMPMRDPARYHARLSRRVARSDRVWRQLAAVTRPSAAIAIAAFAAAGFVGAFVLSLEMEVGDVHAGVPELRPDSVYNRDVGVVTSNFHIGTDVLTVYARSHADACIEYPVVSAIDGFIRTARDVPGVLSVASLTEVGKNNWVGYNQGNPKWRALPRDSNSLIMITAVVEETTGLLNADCSVMPIYIYLSNQRADTVREVVGALQTHVETSPTEAVAFEFAAGNVGITAATNEEVAYAQPRMLLYLFAVIFLLCLITYRRVRVALCILLPLVLISFLVNAIMVLMGIGLKVNTLPVAAIGVGIAVDYGIYICSTLLPRLRAGMAMEEAYYETLKRTGKAVLFIAAVLAVGTASWAFSELQFQADMGILLMLTFLLNGIAAILLLPALLRIAGVAGAEQNWRPARGLGGWVPKL